MALPYNGLFSQKLIRLSTEAAARGATTSKSSYWTVWTTGQKLTNFGVLASTYGKLIPVSFGSGRFVGNVIWAKPYVQTSETYARADTNLFEVVRTFATFAVSFGARGDPSAGVTLGRIWANNALIYDGVSALPTGWVFYTGAEDQMPDPTIEAYQSFVPGYAFDADPSLPIDQWFLPATQLTGVTPAYRGLMYLVIPDFEVTNYGNAIPTITAEIRPVPADYILIEYGWGLSNGYNLNTRTAIVNAGVLDDNGDDLEVTSEVGWSRGFQTGSEGTTGTDPQGTDGAMLLDSSRFLAWTGDTATYGFFYDGVDGSAESVLIRPAAIAARYPDMGAVEIRLRAFWAASIGGFTGRNGNVQVRVTVFRGGAMEIVIPSGDPFDVWQYFNATGEVVSQTTYDFNVTTVSGDGSGESAGPDVDGEDLITLTFPISASAGRIPLANVMTGLAEYVGYAPGEVTTSGITDLVTGAIFDEDQTYRDIAQQIGGAFGFQIIDGDPVVLQRIPTGTDLVIDHTLTLADFVDENDAAFTFSRAKEGDAPGKVSIQYMDEDLDYQWSVQNARRMKFPVATTTSTQTLSFHIPVIITAGEAAGLAAKALYRAISSMVRGGGKLMPQWLKVLPNDVIALTVGAHTYTMKIDEATLGADNTTQINVSAIWTDDALTIGTDAPVSVPSLAELQLLASVVPLNIPLIDVADDTAHASMRIYAAVYAPYPSLTWPGATLYFDDGGGMVTTGSSVTVPATVGTMTSILGTAAAALAIDSGSYTFTVIGPTTALVSLTDPEFAAGGNVAAIGRQGAWEIVRFQTVAVSGTTVTLTTLERGLYGSDVFMSGHAAGETFVLLDGNGIITETIPLGDFLLPYYAEARVTGAATSTYTVQSPFVADGRAERPYAPITLAAAIAGSDIALTWVKRDRLGSLTETSEHYKVEILDAAGTSVLRTVTTPTTGAYTYLAADITADFGSMPATLKWRVSQYSPTLADYGPARSKTSTL